MTDRLSVPVDTVTIGVTISSSDAGRVAALEEMGIEYLWVGGHLVWHHPSPEVMVHLARLSAMTTTAKIGTATLVLPLYQPAVIAKQLADIDVLTNGRLLVGIGVGGESPMEFNACQVPIKERGARADEAIAVVRKLWAGEPVEHLGPFYPMSGPQVLPIPAQLGGPPIYVSGRKKRAIQRAARLGDGWMPYLYSPRRYAESARSLRIEAEAVGRDLSDFAWLLYVAVAISKDGDLARKSLAVSLGGAYSQDFEGIARSIAVGGTRDEVAARLGEYVDAGARHFVVSPGPPGQADETIAILRDEIVPALGERALRANEPHPARA